MIMKNVRTYGLSPYTIVVVHGGPGAPGEMRPVARELSKSFGVLEPLQTADSVKGQIEELRKIIEQNTDKPIYLIGYSWGAWLAYLVAAKYPDLVKKLILVSSGPFEDKYAGEIMQTRMKRLSAEDKEKVQHILRALQNNESDDALMQEFGLLMEKADTFDALSEKEESIVFQPEIYKKVWAEASQLRKSGELLQMGNRIASPVIAIHGEYDPHPADGVREPLSRILKDFHFILLEHCGHTPWKEKQAKDIFYQALEKELLPS